MKHIKSLWARFMVAFVAMLALGAANANAALVEYDGTNVVWDTEVLLTPLVAAVVAAVGVGVVIFLIAVGWKWIRRLAGGSK